MDIRSFFGTSSCKSAPIASSSESELIPPKRHCGSSTVPEKHHTKSHSLSRKQTYNKKWEEDFSLLEYNEDYQEAFCKL